VVDPENRGTPWKSVTFFTSFSGALFPAALAAADIPVTPRMDANSDFKTDRLCVAMVFSFII
jgi:hypothetical protein